VNRRIQQRKFQWNNPTTVASIFSWQHLYAPQQSRVSDQLFHARDGWCGDADARKGG
jgi:hypothetical protein